MKNDELAAVRSVYGQVDGWDIIPCESPDFLFAQDGIPSVGTEVTQFFPSEPYARLTKVRNYPDELLDRESYRHKDDKKEFEVTTAIFQPQDDSSKSHKIKGIFYHYPSLAQRLSRLAACIAGKGDKYPTYQLKVPIVDLVISDGDHGFAFDDFRKFFHPLCRSDVRLRLLQSPFREVFLITRQKPDDSVVVPLKTNLFVASVMLAEQLFLEHSKQKSTEPLMHDFLGGLICFLDERGFGSTSLAINDTGISLQYANVCYTYQEDKRAVESWLVPHRPPQGDSVASLRSEVSPSDEALAQNLNAASSATVICVNIFNRVFLPDPGGA